MCLLGAVVRVATVVLPVCFVCLLAYLLGLLATLFVWPFCGPRCVIGFLQIAPRSGVAAQRLSLCFPTSVFPSGRSSGMAQNRCTQRGQWQVRKDGVKNPWSLKAYGTFWRYPAWLWVKSHFRYPFLGWLRDVTSPPIVVFFERLELSVHRHTVGKALTHTPTSNPLSCWQRLSPHSGPQTTHRKRLLDAFEPFWMVFLWFLRIS